VNIGSCKHEVLWLFLVTLFFSLCHHSLLDCQLQHSKSLFIPFPAMTPHNRYLAIHTNPIGMGDARPTAMDIIRDEHMESALKGKTVLLTGGGAGIGVETARAMAATGADLYITARNLDRARSALTNVLEEHQYTLLEMDQNSLQSVRDAAKRFLEGSKNRCNLLICNAGIMACPQSKTVDGFESQFGVNHLSHFLLFQLLKPALLESATAGFGSRVVMVASSGHRNSGVNFGDIMFEHSEYKPFVAYGQSKTSNIYMANQIERRFGEQAVHGLSLHPGGIRTGLQKHMDQEMVKGWDVSSVSTLSVSGI
jgi:NAD(P)-dependent dehydrogenase (short-subunit alcohol dehydrogenase family)